MNKRKLLQQILNNQKNVKFNDFVTILEAFGFFLARTEGSHNIFKNGGMNMKDYHINIFYSGEDEGYIADIPDLKNCSAFGTTPNEALQQVLISQRLWLEEAHNSNIPIPEPKYRPMIYQVV